MGTIQITGLVGINSPDFILKVSRAWHEGKAVTVLRSSTDQERMKLAGIDVAVEPTAGGGWLDSLPLVHQGDDLAQILFTSGTEGKAKGVMLSHSNLADTVSRLTSAMQLDSSIREYVGVPVYHSFGFGRCRAVSAVGGRCYLPPRGFNPGEIAEMLGAGQINAISAVPSLWRLLLEAGSITPQLGEKVRFIEIGSQYMSSAEKRSLRQLFPQSVIIQHYGLTEASRSTFLEIHKDSVELDSVGRAFDNVELRISEAGQIEIRGPHVAKTAIVHGVQLQLTDSDGWFTTSDRGSINNGYLYFHGRSDDVINCGGLKLMPDALESHMSGRLAHPGPFLICRIPDKLRGDGIALTVEQALDIDDEQLLRAAEEAAEAFGVNARGAIRLVRLEQLPRTETGKLRRREVSEQLAASAPPPQPSALVEAGQGRSLREELARLFGQPSLRDKDTFIALGGDSLRFIQASVILQRRLGHVPSNWEEMPIFELEAVGRRVERFPAVEASILLRAVAIVSVVTNHSGLLLGSFAIDGAAYLLLLPAGFSFARFQLKRVIDTGRASAALSALPRLVVPTIGLIFLQQLRKRSFSIPALFLCGNFINDPDMLHFWFIEVYAQLHFILALALLSPRLRSAFSRDSFRTSLGILAASAAVRFIGPYMWNTEYLYNLVPHMLMWQLSLGFCAYFAQTSKQRWLATSLVIALAATELPMISKFLWILVGGTFLTWVPAVRLPKFATSTVTSLASASLYIYLSHVFVMEPAARLLPMLGDYGKIIAALIVGLLFWVIWDRIWQRATQLLFAFKR